MEPQRGIVIRQVHVDGKTIDQSKYVWLLGSPSNGVVSIEINNMKHFIPQDAVVSCPVPSPSVDALRTIDECFGKSESHFDVLHKSQEKWFRILRCKAHGRLFLEDTRGGAAIYDRLIMVEDDQEDFKAIWSRYHSMSDDWLNYLGIAL